jgi:carbonic anhydrase
MLTRDGSPTLDPDQCACFACSPQAVAVEGSRPHRAFSRRGFLRAGAVASAAGLLAGAGLVAPRPALAQSAIGPDKALAMLMAGNDRYVAQQLGSFQEDLDILKQKTAEKQEPFAGVLSCADSRVPVELLFDQSIGHIFVNRVAGNIATSEIIASLEYGVAVLGTEVIMVLGHSNCGAAKAAIGGQAAPGQISALYSFIRPAVDQAGPDVDAVARANAQIQARLLRESSPVLADFVKQGKLKVVAGFYDLATGKVALLD